jgi:hypothetical protein
VGLGVGEARKWLVGAQAVVEVLVVWLSLIINQLMCSMKSMKYCVGGYFIAKLQFFSSYAKRVVYRAGLKV